MKNLIGIVLAGMLISGSTLPGNASDFPKNPNSE